MCSDWEDEQMVGQIVRQSRVQHIPSASLPGEGSSTDLTRQLHGGLLMTTTSEAWFRCFGLHASLRLLCEV